MAVSENDNLTVLKDVYDGFNRGNLERMRASMTDKTTMYVAPMNQTLKGPNAIIDYFRVYRQAFEATVNVTRQSVCGDLILSEFTAKGTHKGVFFTPMGDIQPTGRRIDVPVCHILQFKEGKITDIHEYFDVSTLMTQLGIGLVEERHAY